MRSTSVLILAPAMMFIYSCTEPEPEKQEEVIAVWDHLSHKNAATNTFRLPLSEDSVNTKLMALLKGKWRAKDSEGIKFLNTRIDISDTVVFENSLSTCMTGWGKIVYNNSVKFYFTESGNDQYEYYITKDSTIVITQFNYRNKDFSFKDSPEAISLYCDLQFRTKDSIAIGFGREWLLLNRIKD